MSTTTRPEDHPRARAIGTGTGTELGTWVERIDEAGGRELDHAAIARLLPERWEITEWWAQGVTVAYEQIIGRRVVGQSCEGDFAASASRTVAGTPEEVRGRWDAFMTPQRREELGLGAPSLTDTERWRYWRAAASDGTRLSVNITAKDEGRSTLGLEHKGIETSAGRDAWKAAWKTVLTAFAADHKEHS
ncbi:hypothetical protein [Brachybacterium sp. YJGR34]|uniref:hypothetical protein n=1 Tax=Brachybacterium sp. YJGR34 TaxID=2059911 RepID=UPI000E0AB718|nr:hypothetical protein [Brachybacterium sp. YJGR34]